MRVLAAVVDLDLSCPALIDWRDVSSIHSSAVTSIRAGAAAAAGAASASSTAGDREQGPHLTSCGRATRAASGMMPAASVPSHCSSSPA